eukprot:jgi/Bigna1/52380/estExt_Genewise1Plus.C_70193
MTGARVKRSISVIFVKCIPTLEADKPLGQQIYMCQVKDGAPYEAMLNFVRHAFLPYSRSIMATDKEDAKDMTDFNILRTVNSTLSELEISLLRCQQNIEIPQIVLEIHPVIQEIVSRKPEEGKITMEDLPKLDTDKFLNEITSMSGDWKKLISSVTKLDRDVASGSTKEEIHFWVSMDSTLKNIDKQLKSRGVEFTFQILKQNQRYLATTGFREECGLDQCMEKVRVYTDILRDFPIRNLIEAVTIGDLTNSITLVFKHIKSKKIAKNQYPLERALGLIRTISRDVSLQVRSLLSAKDPMNLSFEDFQRVASDCKNLFRKWEQCVELFMGEVRKARRATRDASYEHETYREFSNLKKRIVEVRKIRKEHDQLIRVIDSTLKEDQIVRQSSLKQIDDAYEFLKGVPTMDTSKEVNDGWKLAVRNYNAKIEYVEAELEERIRSLLDKAKDANEMFRVCSKFNDLFVRPRIQAAIRSYQQPLIETVKAGINTLHDKFKIQYSRSEASRMSRLHDLPPVSGAIIWLRQIERQLKLYMKKVEDILGKKWHHHVEGKNLRRIYDIFRKKLETAIQRDQLEGWIRRWKKPASSQASQGVVFKIDEINEQPMLAVNFDKKLITLFKEVRNLSNIPNVRVPYEIQIQANEAKMKYPFAVRLEEVLRIYNRTCARINKYPLLEPMVARMKKKVQDTIYRGVGDGYHWTSEKLKPFVSSLGSLTQVFQDNVDNLITKGAQVKEAILKLTKVDPEPKALEGVVQEIQSSVDYLEKNGYSNLGHYVSELDEQLENILAKRLKQLIKQWMEGVDIPFDKLKEMEIKAAVSETEEEDAHMVKTRQLLKIMSAELKDPIEHEINLRSNVLSLEPPMQTARLRLCQSLNHVVSVICSLPRINCWSTKSMKTDMTKSEQLRTLTYSTSLEKIVTDDINACMERIEGIMIHAEEYVSKWLQYQALWDMDVDMILKEVQGNVHCWEDLLRDMKVSRRAFESSGRLQQHFGPIVIKYGTVQQRVVNKVDSWHKTIIGNFANVLGTMMRKSFALTSEGRKKMEDLTMDFKSTEELIANVTILQKLKNDSVALEKDIKAQVGVEKMLERQRFIFPANWLYSDGMIGEWTSYQQILRMKLSLLSHKTPMLQKSITDEDIKITAKIKDFISSWKDKRPVEGNLDFRNVIKSLTLFQSSLTGLEKELGDIENAKQALEMPVRAEKALAPVKEEILGLQEVWEHLGKIWEALEALGEKSFQSVRPEAVRGELKRMQGSLSNLSGEMRSYDAFDFLKKQLESYQKLYVHFVTLRSPVLRKKHQRQVLKELRITKIWEHLTVMDLWKADLQRHKEALLAIQETAQGESALEEYLATVATAWEETKFILAEYDRKCYLIRNWNDMFKQLTEHLTDLASMRQSPFFKVFEREALRWEQTLNLAQEILEVFSEVQRRWIYLEGIFSSSVDVQTQLAFQYRRFKTFDREFVRLMREIKLESSTLYWFSQERALLPRLEQYRDILTTIQKALGVYLEKQRSQFPRFYFVGDDDLLEIIGNAKDPLKVMRHLPKMFAGITSLTLEDKNVVVGMNSREGEQVSFEKKISVSQCKTVHEWLRKVENEMKTTLAGKIGNCVMLAKQFAEKADEDMLCKWVEPSPAQAVLLSSQVGWSAAVESALASAPSKRDRNASGMALKPCLEQKEQLVKLMAEKILAPMKPEIRKKYEQLITEVVHQRDVIRLLIECGVCSESDFEWLANLRYAWDMETKDYSEKLQIKIARAQFTYGFEYLGVGERLVQTPLTDRCYLTLCEALHMRMGGNPFGPAGTGKTESVKMLGTQLGLFVLVFCCDESFDLAAMGRIFVGLCQCGAWGCFDEFNRLEERILSAVSQQIQIIQEGLKQEAEFIFLGEDKKVQLNNKMGIFVTMNPGYAGRSNLPDNLKQLFRGMAMMRPDRNLIAQVTLYSQGFRTAEFLSPKIVLLFELCKDQLSSQSHYDFGLRSLKSVLRSAGGLKRKDIAASQHGENPDWKEIEQNLLVKSMCMTVVPKLISQDLGLFKNLLRAVFPSSHLLPPNVEKIREAVIEICKEKQLLPTDAWMTKIMELNQVQSINHGVILVGPSGTGKSSAWRVLLEALERVDETKQKSKFHIIDPKAISKDELYGTLDATTLEWTNGVFTFILRKILDDVRDDDARHWIIFDGDVDPEWAENLNSVLDDNKLLTLPNGERLMLSDNIRIIFEVKDLNYATPATVSRCGMVWFSEEIVTTNMICSNLLQKLSTQPISGVPDTVRKRWSNVQRECCSIVKSELRIKVVEDCKTLNDLSEQDSPYIDHIYDYCKAQANIMPLERMQGLGTLFSLLSGGISRVILYNDTHPDFPLNKVQIEKFMKRYIVMAVLWAFGGAMSLADRNAFCRHLPTLTNEALPPLDEKSVESGLGGPLIDFDVRADSGEWEKWSEHIGQVELEPQNIPKPDVVIETVDTYRHSVIIRDVVLDHRPLILCGPPGSGKSMTLTAVLRALPNFELVTLNFSSSTDPALLRKTLNHHCQVQRTSRGHVMSPIQQDKRLVIFCDEINLPETDGYNTQAVITFLRQILEHGGFWDAKELVWITLERVQIIGACNPPTDAGRVPMTPRFLRHTMVLFVDFPAPDSLKQIYGTFNRALVKNHRALKAYAGAITDAMVSFYRESQSHFTPDVQPHYIYSPRELSRWVRAMYEAMHPEKLQGHTLLPEDLVRLFAHEALRLFQDRLVEKAEREWTDEKLNAVILKNFPGVDLARALRRPILFSEWLNKRYVSVDQENLRKHVVARLHTFNEEELDVKLVIFDEVLEHILRIDRVLRQPLGHLLLVGASGSGKTILSKFVSWMNGMKVFQLKVHKHYSTKDFDEDLRGVLIRSGCKHEKICFIFDESNVLDTAFLERMNALLASGEVPGLFEDTDYKNLMQECREMGKREGKVLGSDEERYKRFCANVQRNLHIVFTMNPSNEDFSNRSATSPALFNRCVIDWFGEWSDKALYQVGFDFTKNLDLGDAVDVEDDIGGEGHDSKLGMLQARSGSQRDSVVQTMVFIHESVQNAMEQLAKARNGRSTFVTPRHYLDFIKHYKKLFLEKREEFEEQQVHLRNGLKKLAQTEETVGTMRAELNIKNQELQEKEREAKEKMAQIQQDSIEAENQKQASLKIKKEQEAQDKIISERKAKVEAGLANAIPMIEAAKHSVRSIERKYLDEVKNLRSPPALVKLGMEPVIMMVTGSTTKVDWQTVRRTVGKTDFIPKILAFDSRSLSEKVARYIKKHYLSDDNFTYEKISRASQACGPLVKWVSSQITFCEILNQVAPMEKELKELEGKSEVLSGQQEKVQILLDSLTSRLKGLSDEYKVLISEAARIEDQLKNVQVKVDRSVKLLANLSSEKDRWTADSKEYEKQISTLVGDSLLAAAFLAYIGYFNQGYRERLFDMWTDYLNDFKVETKVNLSVIEYLSKPSQRLEWQAHRLPNDTLCFENAIMMTRFNRYPLIIDPSGQAVSHLLDFFNNNKNSKRKMIRTSFLDPAFLKCLESALRFGNALLVEDVENIDPVLNSVLNREIFKSGGRIMITVGAKEIDFSPHFTIFLSTRDPSCHFTPDLCSRVTFVNFSATQASLASQCLNKVLKSERPDIDKKRSDLLKLQGEFKVQLRKLEDDVLTALNSVKTNILEDDQVMLSLETLKKNAMEISKKMKDSETVMETFTQAASVYEAFSSASAQIYFTLEELSTTHFLYQFSLPFFLKLVDDTLDSKKNTALADLPEGDRKEPAKRLKVIQASLYRNVYYRAGRGLLAKDHIAFGLRLAQICLSARRASSSERDGSLIDYNEVQFLLKVKPTAYGAQPQLPSELASGMQNAQLIMLGKLSQLPGFKKLVEHMSSNPTQWRSFISGEQEDEEKEEAEGDRGKRNSVLMPSGWEVNDTDKVRQGFQRILVSRVLRLESLELQARSFVDSVFGQGFCDQLNNPDLDEIVTSESDSTTPLLLVTFPGYDASTRVTSLASRLDQQLTSLAMGSPEGFSSADTAINLAARKGNWILLTNVHLAPSWLSSLEKRLHRLNAHNNFRIFLTMEMSPKVPADLVRMSNVVIFEPPRGIKSSMIRIFSSLPKARVDRAPAERSRLYFLLAWLHSIILERLRYTPVGWTKTFEFSEADYRCATAIVDEWVDKIGKGRRNVRPSQLPWGAIQTSLRTIVYGGRIDNVYDQERLDAFVKKLFSAESYGGQFPLATKLDRKTKKIDTLLRIPDCRSYDEFYKWIKETKDISSPEFLGLPCNAEALLLREQATRLLSVFSKLQIYDTEVGAVKEGGGGGGQRRRSIASQHPPWYERVKKLVNYWVKAVPPSIKLLPSGPAASSSALIRCLQREISLFKKVHSSIREDIKNAQEYLDGNQSGSNRTREVLRMLGAEDRVPKWWDIQPRPTALSASNWMQDFINRVEGINEIAKTPPKEIGRKKPIWLGGLYSPEAFVAASRQEIARSKNCAVDSLSLVVTIDDSGDSLGDDFIYHGFTLFGAECDQSKLSLSDLEFQKLKFAHFQWKSAKERKEKNEEKSVSFPVYLESSRERFLFQISLPYVGNHDHYMFSERGTCVTVWSPPV